MSMFTRKATKRLSSPEWVVSGRADREVDDNLSGGWGVIPAPLSRGASYTDFGKHQISVPDGDTPEAVAVRLHELTHARISPTNVPSVLLDQLGISSEAVRLAEEVRVNLVSVLSPIVTRSLAEQDESRKIDDDLVAITDAAKQLADGTEQGASDMAVQLQDWRSAVTVYLATLNLASNKVVRRRLRRNKNWRTPLDEIGKYLRKEGIDISRGRSPWFATTHSRYRQLRNTEPQQYTFVDRRTGRRENVFIPTGFIDFTLPLANVIDRMFAVGEGSGKPQNGEGEHTEKSSKPDNYGFDKANWETLRWGLTDLTETTTAFIGKRKRPAMTGKSPVRPDRLLTDPERRIFRETARARGGIVVFDCSGSMAITHDEVHQVVTQFAGATVVAYTSRGHASRNLPNAWVLADRGRMISRDDFDRIDLGHGNGVDGPILDWAIRKRKSRKDFIVWVSDGHVTGQGDRQSRRQLLEVAEMSMKANIIGVDTSDEAIQLLADMKRTGGTPRNRYARKTEHTIRRLKATSFAEIMD